MGCKRSESTHTIAHLSLTVAHFFGRVCCWCRSIIPCANIMREYGVRLKNAAHNVGKPAFAFNILQRKLLPQVRGEGPGEEGSDEGSIFSLYCMLTIFLLPVALNHCTHHCRSIARRIMPSRALSSLRRHTHTHTLQLTATTNWRGEARAGLDFEWTWASAVRGWGGANPLLPDGDLAETGPARGRPRRLPHVIKRGPTHTFCHARSRSGPGYAHIHVDGGGGAVQGGRAQGRGRRGMGMGDVARANCL
jgi:hypothetical protein